MSGKIPKYGDFSIESGLIDEHEWVSDYLIDGELASKCTLIYPPTYTECPNCVFDQQTGQSANIYKAGGPAVFTNHTICPWCNGQGKSSNAPTDSVRLRVYWGGSELNAAVKMFKTLGVSNLDNAMGLIFVIGYMSDISKFERADAINVISTLNKKEYMCIRKSEAVPWGFRHNRYFAAMVSRR